MTDSEFPFTNKADATVRWLLPRNILPAVTLVASDLDLRVSDYLRVQEQIGTPKSLDSEIEALLLDGEQRLPPALASKLAAAVTLFAMAMEVFDDRKQAHHWWLNPIRLSEGGPIRPPRDWSSDAGATTELASRIRRTLSGIY